MTTIRWTGKVSKQGELKLLLIPKVLRNQVKIGDTCEVTIEVDDGNTNN